MTVELQIDTVEKIKAKRSEEVAEDGEEPAPDMQTAVNLVLENAVVRSHDRYCADLFGVPNFPADTPLQEAFAAWKENNSDYSTEWIDELLAQLVRASCWSFPKVSWAPMETARRRDSYVPAVHFVRRLPAKEVMQFDIYFLPVLHAPEPSKEGTPENSS